MDSKDYAVIAARAAEDKKAQDLVIQDVRELLGETDYFVIATASNRPQIEAVCEKVEEELLAKASIKPIATEGKDACEWVLMDYGSIVVHVFLPDIRDFYRLEALWGDAPLVEF